MKGMESKRLFAKGCAIMSVALLCLTALMVLASPAKAQPVEYVSTLTSLTRQRAGAAVSAADDGIIYVMGGRASSGGFCLDSVLAYNPNTGETVAKQKMLWGVFGAPCAKGNDGKIYVFGGENNSGFLGYTQIYDPAANTWSSGTSMAYLGYLGAAVTASDGRIFVFGGWGTLSGETNLTQIYNPVANTWAAGKNVPTHGWGSSAVATGTDTIMLIGGWNESTGLKANAYVYTISTNSWSSKAPLNAARNYLGAVMGRNGFVYAFGGVASRNLLFGVAAMNSIERYNSTADLWEYTGPVLSQARDLFGTAVDATGRIFMVGGWTGSAVISSVEMMIVLNIDGAYKLVITSPADGSVVSDSVSVNAMLKNAPVLTLTAVDFLVDGSLVETQLAGKAWTFVWDTTGVPDSTQHKLTVRGYASWGAVTEDSVTVTVSAMSVEERVAAIEAEIAALQSDLADLQSSVNLVGANVTDLQTRMSLVQTQLSALAATQTTQGSQLTGLNSTLTALQQQLDELQSQLDKVKTTSDNGSTWGMINLVLIIVVIVLLALMLMMVRRKP